MSCLTERSRSGVPALPLKYFCVTMFVAVIDQNFGTSTSFCSKKTSPLSFVIAAVRSSQSMASKGCVTPSVKRRRKVRPRSPARVATGSDSVWVDVWAAERSAEAVTADPLVEFRILG